VVCFPKFQYSLKIHHERFLPHNFSTIWRHITRVFLRHPREKKKCKIQKDFICVLLLILAHSVCYVDTPTQSTQLSARHEDIGKSGGVVAIISNSAMDGREWLAWHPAAFSSGKQPLILIEYRAGRAPEIVLANSKREKSLAPAWNRTKIPRPFSQ
jgi:hypothetical protein